MGQTLIGFFPFPLESNPGRWGPSQPLDHPRGPYMLVQQRYNTNHRNLVSRQIDDFEADEDLAPARFHSRRAGLLPQDHPQKCHRVDGYHRCVSFAQKLEIIDRRNGAPTIHPMIGQS